MDKILKNSKGFYQSKNPCNDTKKCYENLTERVPLISCDGIFKECIDEWSHIIGHKYNGKEETTKDVSKRKAFNGDIKIDLCLCGMSINKIYYIINDKNKNIVQLGGNCVKRINPAALRKYKESLKVKYYCDICETNSKDKEKHLLTKKHINNYKKFNEKRIKILNKHIEHKLYIQKTRKCMNCTNRILLTEPKWKKACLDCWKKSKKH